MSVIVIGDRAVGKTSMVYALIDPREQERVSVSVEQGLDYTKVTPTDELNPKTLKMVVDLPVPREIQVQWFDTPGEAFTNRQWRKERSSEWDGMKQKMSQSRYIVLLLPPDRNSVNPQQLDSKDSLDDFQTPEIWERRVIEWLNFINQECSAAKHILICFNKADLFCDIEAERQMWLYKTSGFSWANYSDHVLKCYFKGVEKTVKQYISKNRSRLVTFFITTNKNRSLLELPWLYIGSFETSKVS